MELLIRQPWALTPQVAASAVMMTGQMRVTTRKLDAYAALFGGLGTAASLLLFATGNDRAGYAFGMATGIVSGVLAFVRILGADEESAP